MAYTGSLLGNYAPQMQEPYSIESTLVPGQETGNPAAIALASQYNFERQIREGDYASRLANQMAFGQAQLRQQNADTVLKSMPELYKAGLGPATQAITTSMLPGLDTTGLQAAADQASATAQAANAGNYGKFLGGAANYGLNIPDAALSTMTGGMPGVTRGTPVPVQAAAMKNQGMIDAARIRAAGGGAGGKTTNIAMQPQPDLNNASPNIPVPRAIVMQGPQATADYLRQHNWLTSPQQAPNPNATGAVNTAPPPVAGRTNLPPAPAATGTAAAAPATAITPSIQRTGTAATLPKMPPPGTTIDKNAPALQQTKAAIDATIANNKGLSPAERANLQNYKLVVGPDNQVHLHDGAGNDRGVVGKRN